MSPGASAASGHRWFTAAADDELTIYERSKEGRRAFTCPPVDVPVKPLDELLPASLRRADGPKLPEVSEPEIVRHYNRLSKRNFDLDTGFYPLGSCTMKHNPKLHERVAALPGHAKLHPLQDPRHAQGALELMWRLQQELAAVAGLPHVSLQPSAGSHGELAGVLLTRAYHEDRGEHRTKVLTPDSAHGTNPATVTMAGYEVVKVGTDARGNVDIDDLRAKTGDDVACLMLTNPSTLGLFEEGIQEIARIVHDAGATLYYDGANLNAIMNICRPGDMGFDIVHFNLHKSFTQPHGGGGPGAGPIAVSERIEPYLPRPVVVRRDAGEGNGASSPFYDLDYDRPKSIGRLRGFQGNYGVFVRSYAYIRSLGAAGLREVSEVAVLNANYLLARLMKTAHPPLAEYLPAGYDRICMHEFVLSGAPMKRELEIKTLDLAKRLLDYGVHPPTVYFPLIVDEALLVEPTETETKETLDRFAEIVAEVLREAREDPTIAQNAPYTTPVRRLDEAGAARRPVVRQPLRSPARPVRLLAAGGTIGMVAHPPERAVPALDARGLIEAVPALARVPTLEAETVLSVPSVHLTLDQALALARRAAAAAAGGEGVVISTGTDTLEEVAVLCELLHGAGAPIVITGANRPATGPGADGPANLVDAVAVAGSSAADGLGVVVVFGGEIHDAMTVRKVDSTGPAAFGSPLSGPLGRVVEGRAWVHASPVRHVTLPVEALEHRVEIISPGLGDDGALLRHAAEVADGIVLVAFGAGHLSPALLAALREAAARIPVVITCRPTRSSMLVETYGFEGSERDVRASGALCAPFLSPAAARIVLLACLGPGLDRPAMEAALAAWDVEV